MLEPDEAFNSGLFLLSGLIRSRKFLFSKKRGDHLTFRLIPYGPLMEVKERKTWVRVNSLKSKQEGDFMPKPDDHKKVITQDKDFLAELIESKETTLYCPITVTASFRHNGKSNAARLVMHHLLRDESLTSVRGVQKKSIDKEPASIVKEEF